MIASRSCSDAFNFKMCQIFFWRSMPPDPCRGSEVHKHSLTNGETMLVQFPVGNTTQRNNRAYSISKVTKRVFGCPYY